MAALLAAFAWLLLLETRDASGGPPSLFACMGEGCEAVGADPPPTPVCAAAATDPEAFNQVFARGCLAKRDFGHARSGQDAGCSRSDPGCAARGTGSALDPVRLPTVEVIALPESDEILPPTLETRFASALVLGNPEVSGGKIRHGAFHALGMYWGSDPLSFLYLNLRHGLGD